MLIPKVSRLARTAGRMMGRGRGLGVVVGWSVAVAAAYGCSGTNLTGDAGDVPVNPAETIGTPCLEAATCDDGEPCNGVETCSPETGRCVAGLAPPDFTQCTTADGRFASCVDGRCDLDYEEMFVPAGPFVMGCDSVGTTDCTVVAGPQHVVTVSAYFIDRYEVSNRRYSRCQQHGACRPGHGGERPRNDRAVTWVNWYEAVAYCAYEGKRLPTEAE
jgi:hypothetical protein